MSELTLAQESRPEAERDLAPWLSLLLAVALTSLSFLLQARVGFNPADEGFLWYGVQRTVAGEVPLRDFQSYEPGRYYWSAAGALVFGRGLVALRLAEAIAQVIGLWLGLMAVSRLTRDWSLLGAIGLMLLIWMFPSHKLFDHALLLAGIWFATRLLERPGRLELISAGLFVGLCAFVGKNHALYQGAAQAVLLLLLFFKRRREMIRFLIVFWSLGVAAGLLPLLVMLLCVPGFAGAYQLSLAEIFRHGANLALPFPWPWRILSGGGPVSLITSLTLGLFLLAMPLVYLAVLAACSLFSARFSKNNALLAASSALGLFYLHHGYSRADISHLAQAVHPLLLCLLAAPVPLARRRYYLISAAGLLFVIGFIAVGTKTPIARRLVSPVAWAKCDLGDEVFLSPGQEKLFELLRKFAAENIDPHEGVLIAPSAPGLYSVLDRVSPLWEIYFLFPATEERQEEMIRSLTNKEVNWAIVSNQPMDGREELRFSATHPLLWKYLEEKFHPVGPPPLPGRMVILHRIGASREAPGRAISPPSVR